MGGAPASPREPELQMPDLKTPHLKTPGHQISDRQTPDRQMDIGVFIPIGNNGWLISETSPQYMPSFALNKEIVLKAEGYGFDFALSMIKLRGFGGKTQFWEHNLESFTLMAGLAAVTHRIRIFATAATLTLPPAIVARMASTIDSIAPGRFGVNLVTGWQKAEYNQMGLWPGDAHYNPGQSNPVVVTVSNPVNAKK